VFASRTRSAYFMRCSLSLAAVVCLASCATQPDPTVRSPGFVLGLFHGLVAIVTLVASLFIRVRVYAFPNSGFWYDAGFVLGFAASILLLVLLSMARIGGFLTREGD
jgi:hypothetical protein